MRRAWLVECGRMPYGQAWALQRALLAARQDDRIPDTVLLLEHPPVITVGRGGRASNILAPEDALAARGIDVYEVERGGDVTYHGPGQLVGYPILNLRALDEDVVRYVRLLEATLITALEGWAISAERMRGFPGVWVQGAKIAAIGVAVKRKVTLHGFALNVAPDLSHFDLINPCGLGKPVTSMALVLGRALSLGVVGPAVSRAFEDTFQVTLAPVTIAALGAHVQIHPGGTERGPVLGVPAPDAPV
jgi:lipoate-protein ligase B